METFKKFYRVSRDILAVIGLSLGGKFIWFYLLGRVILGQNLFPIVHAARKFSYCKEKL